MSKILTIRQGRKVERVSLATFCRHASDENCAAVRALAPGESADLTGSDGKGYIVSREGGRGKTARTPPRRRIGKKPSRRAVAAPKHRGTSPEHRKRKRKRHGKLAIGIAAASHRRVGKKKARSLHIPLPVLRDRMHRLEQIVAERQAAGENGHKV